MELRRFAVCHECLAALRLSRRPSVRMPLAPQWTTRNVTTTATTTTTTNSTRRTRWQQSRAAPTRRHVATAATPPPPPPPPSPPPSPPPDLPQIQQRVQELAASILERETTTALPAEEHVLDVLRQLQSLAQRILGDSSGGGEGSGEVKAEAEKKRKKTATAALLGSVSSARTGSVVSSAAIVAAISARAEEMVRHPAVFLTPAVLRAYVQLQSLLQRPASLPDVLHLYARKPVPRISGGEVVYSAASPDQIKAAVPSDAAQEALAAAIHAHQLPLAMDIISTSYCTPAFKKAKTFRQAAVPLAGLAVAPVAAYTLSTQFSHLQQTMDTGAATGIAFAGIMTYVGAVAMTGYVAVTTSNDQMMRVTWASGVPLWERWVREEERAAMDQLAQAWGFKDLDKRGEEEGEEWEALREWIGSRGMILDRVSLMPGME